MGSSAPDPLAPPARNPGGRTPRSSGLPLGLPRAPSRLQCFLNPSAARVRGSDNPRSSPPRSPGQHSTGQTSPRPTTSGPCPLGPPLTSSRLGPQRASEEAGLASQPRSPVAQLRAVYRGLKTTAAKPRPTAQTPPRDRPDCRFRPHPKLRLWTGPAPFRAAQWASSSLALPPGLHRSNAIFTSPVDLSTCRVSRRPSACLH